ncbi:hypothetical protein COCMIDRAFT_8874 [Bipolaris oryzae ATCC 44560]|uniref:Heterokaryon incompatibility domain-containing protein n=1 Tax=Bipolaris oryzae ATCC 44560 TaxID=930090 RepID=W6ZCF3_COCMI|nr:uncharacterized protein COCMIDRAFT_8874 [Bipolaris oryzae ATCC 44560]EUC41411.1 hypothetical protein COCMIDRAFT_8874 [Bipolaris oryzae ATCC 44560]
MDIYVYEPIDLERPAFRLLQLLRGRGSTIECMLYQAYLDGTDTIPYNALSYTWGGTNKTSTVTVNGKTLDVTENLYSALRHLRSEDVDRVFWVDAICIDQDNEIERGHQVQQMCKIYSHAEEVVVWLGQPTAETNVLMDSLRQLEEYSLMYAHRHWDLAQWAKFWRSVPQNPYFEPRQGLDLLLSRPWFRRVWILQEIANVKKASVWCGIKSVKAHIFALAPSLIGIKPERHCQAVLDIMPGHLREETWWCESRDLYNLLLKFRESNASDPRDKIYALLGISSDACDTDSLRPTYTKDLQTVIRDTSLFLFGRSDVSYETMPMFLEDLTFRNSLSFLELVRMSDAKAVQHFLMRRGLEVSLSEAMIKAAAENQENGQDIMNFLIQKRGSEITVTDRIIKAAARNKTSGRDIIICLFQTCEHEFKLTKEALKVLQDVLSEIFGEMFRNLLEETADVDIRDEDLNIVLSMMSKGGHIEDFELLRNSIINAGNEFYATALHAASAIGHEAVVKLLLERGAKINIEGAYRSPLHAASARGHEAVVRLLLERGAKINIEGAYRSLLYAASEKGHEAVVKLLLDKVADVDVGDGYYQTALRAASAEGHEAVVELLRSRKQEKPV